MLAFFLSFLRIKCCRLRTLPKYKIIFNVNFLFQSEMFHTFPHKCNMKNHFNITKVILHIVTLRAFPKSNVFITLKKVVKVFIKVHLVPLTALQ